MTWIIETESPLQLQLWWLYFRSIAVVYGRKIMKIVVLSKYLWILLYTQI